MRNNLRQLLKKFYGTAICMLACFVAMLLFTVSSPQDTAALETSVEPAYKVVSPIGESTVKMGVINLNRDNINFIKEIDPALSSSHICESTDQQSAISLIPDGPVQHCSQNDNVSQFKFVAKMTTMAPRMDTLADKTICMVWNNAFKADVTFPAIGEALKKQYPGIKIVPYTDMPVAFLPEPPGTPGKESEALQAAFKEKGCNAVISGNGG